MQWSWLWLFIGGGVGAVARYALSVQVLARLGEGFPWGTLAVNWTGCLAIGIAAATFDVFPGHPPGLRLLLVTGILGGFTTFSAAGLETWQLLASDQFGHAALYIGGSLAGGVGAVGLGVLASRSLLHG